MSRKAKATGRFVCPYIESTCEECGAPFPHRVEELIQKGQKIPFCASDGAPLVRDDSFVMPVGLVGQLARVIAETAARE